MQFLRFAVGLATAVSGLHKRELIQKDVKPANGLVDPTIGQVRLMGFGIASRLSRERQAPEPPAPFGAICFTGSTCFRSLFLLCASEKKTSPCWSSTSLVAMPEEQVER